MSFFSLLEMRGTYAWKPAFQRLLLPFVRSWLAPAFGQTRSPAPPALCRSDGRLLAADRQSTLVLLLPAVLLVRMALNAVDGMLARQFGQSSRLGVYLNELGDVISDVFLYLPFAHLPGFRPFWVWSVVVLAVSSEMAGALGVMAGSNRRYDGPMGKKRPRPGFWSAGLLAGLTSQLPRQIGYITPRSWHCWWH